MRATIKICGLKDFQAIDVAIDSGAKYLGFVCDYPKSPRNCSPQELVSITKKINQTDIFKVAVMVNPDDKTIEQIHHNVEYIQLHGGETESRIKDIKSKFNIKILKAIKVSLELDLKQIDLYPSADDLLIDTPAMEKSELFNFNLLDNLNISSYFLAGGISIDNVHQALQFTSKIDISSGLESEPGKKDLDKITNFMNEVKKHA